MNNFSNFIFFNLQIHHTLQQKKGPVIISDLDSKRISFFYYSDLQYSILNIFS